MLNKKLKWCHETIIGHSLPNFTFIQVQGYKRPREDLNPGQKLRKLPSYPLDDEGSKILKLGLLK